MTLPDYWFFAIAFLFTGYFVLEGFDFGVGMLLPILGAKRADAPRRTPTPAAACCSTPSAPCGTATRCG